MNKITTKEQLFVLLRQIEQGVKPSLPELEEVLRLAIAGLVFKDLFDNGNLRLNGKNPNKVDIIND
jgi:hypothetical protein